MASFQGLQLRFEGLALRQRLGPQLLCQAVAQLPGRLGGRAGAVLGAFAGRPRLLLRQQLHLTADGLVHVLPQLLHFRGEALLLKGATLGTDILTTLPPRPFDRSC